MPHFIDVKIISHLDFYPSLMCLQLIWSSLSLNCWYSKEKFSLNSTVLCKSNESEFQGNLPKLCVISKEAKFCRYFDEPIVPISLKFHANVRNFAWHFVPRWKFHLRKRNFVQQFITHMHWILKWFLSISKQATFVPTAGRFSLVASFYWEPWLTRGWLVLSKAWHLHVSASFQTICDRLWEKPNVDKHQ